MKLSRESRPWASQLTGVEQLDELNGDFINLECVLPNGETGKIMDDNKKYWATQVEIPGSEKCYGIAADERMIAVYRNGCGGSDSELALWVKISLQ